MYYHYFVVSIVEMYLKTYISFKRIWVIMLMHFLKMDVLIISLRQKWKSVSYFCPNNFINTYKLIMFPSSEFMPQEHVYRIWYFKNTLLLFFSYTSSCIAETDKIMSYIVFRVRLRIVGWKKKSSLIKPLLSVHYIEQWASSWMVCSFKK